MYQNWFKNVVLVVGTYSAKGADERPFEANLTATNEGKSSRDMIQARWLE